MHTQTDTHTIKQYWNEIYWSETVCRSLRQPQTSSRKMLQK